MWYILYLWLYLHLHKNMFFFISFYFILFSPLFSIQSLPSTKRATIMDATVSPEELRQVAAGSTKNPMVAIIGNASPRKPKKLTISISPTSPPPGAPESTNALKNCYYNGHCIGSHPCKWHLKHTKQKSNFSYG